MTEKIIQNKQDLKEWLSIELPFYGRNKLHHKFMQVTEGDILRRHQWLLRHTEYHMNTGHKLRYMFFRILLLKIQNKYGMHFEPNSFGKGLKIMHIGERLMNDPAIKVGENCTFHVNTALVMGGRDSKLPTLGNGVIVGFGSVIVGDVFLADNIAVGANSVVNKSFYEPNITIAGSPARKISDHGALEWGNHDE